MTINYHVYSQKELMLHAMVGRVITSWARLENQLLRLIAWGLRISPTDAAAITSSFKTFSLTLDFTQAVCKPRVQYPVFVNSLFDVIRELSGDRNFIAHTEVIGHGAGEPEEIDWSAVDPHIGPAIQEYLTGNTAKREPMDIAEVHEIAEDIQHLVSITMNFISALNEGQPLLETYQKPIALRRPRLAERRSNSGKAR